MFISRLLPFLVIFLLVSAAQTQDCEDNGKTKSASLRLKSNLLCGYDRTLRPVKNHKTATNVTIGLFLKFFQYDHHSSSFTVDAWVSLAWKDEYLTWNPSDFEGLKYTNFHSSEIWVPDISVYNRFDQSGNPTIVNDHTCLVSFKGIAYCIVPNRQTTLCIADMRKFPFDTQNCTLHIGSWIYSGEKVFLTTLMKTPINIQELYSTGEWELLNSFTVQNKGTYDCCPNASYPSIQYFFTIGRMGQGYLATMVLPMLSLLVTTLSSLCIDPLSIGRLLICYFNITYHFLFIQYVSWHVVMDGVAVPQILIFGRDSLILATFIIAFTLILKNLIESKKTAPRWVSSVVGILTTSRPGQFILLNSDAIRVMARLKGEGDEGAIIDNSETNNTNNNQDWIIFGRILDRFCFLIYTFIYICMFVAFFP